ncbi:MAG TPA: metallophosphoesterase [Candidatus Cybelea sp.]|nr:metallophosphoesterase [Candidatus Cybelea sp.]
MTTPTFRIVQISDTHLSRSKPWCVSNFAALERVVAARKPDLVVNTGDITFDGADEEDDLAFAQASHAALGVPVRAIPGNHDIGDNPWTKAIRQTVTAERLARYRRFFGPDFWQADAGAWVMIGLNAQLMGSGLADEAAQWSFLAGAVAMAGRRPIALFIHKPLFNEHVAEKEVVGRYVPPEQRRRLDDVLRGANVKLVASGHVHQHRHRNVAGVDYCWAPSTAFVLPDRLQPCIGTKRVGYVAYTFAEDEVAIEIVEAPELTNHDLDDFPEVFG